MESSVENRCVTTGCNHRRGEMTQACFKVLGLIVICCLFLLTLPGCGSNQIPHASRMQLSGPGGDPSRLLPSDYRLHVGDELAIKVMNEADFSNQIKVRPDGLISSPGTGEIQAAGRTLSEISEEISTNLKRWIKYPEVSVMLIEYAKHSIYVFGEVYAPGVREYTPNMSVLHALGAAGGSKGSGKLSSVLVLRRTGPSDLEVYRVDLEEAVDGHVMARDIFLQPFDIVFVPRSIIGEINLFVDQFMKQNIAPFTAYIEGWRAFNVDNIYYTR